jgi:hypothetical protein
MLRIYDFGVETLRLLRPVVATIASHDPDLARQLGSTRESVACLDAADALGYSALDAALRDRFERIAATLVNVVR